MKELWVVPAGMKTSGGTGEPVDIGGLHNRVLAFVLQVTSVVEQQALEVILEWSSDGQLWGRMAAMPQQFYVGETELLLDLRPLPEVRWVRARWVLERWGRGKQEVACDFGLVLHEAAAM